MERGLRASIWAPKNYENPNSSRLSATWTCTSCGFPNYLRRIECFRCGLGIKLNNDDILDRAQASLTIDHYNSVAGPDKGEVRQENSNSLIQGQITGDSPKHLKGNGGLSTSRWSPRNYSGRNRKVDEKEIWTRTVVINKPTSIPAENEIPATSSHPDLGLPYEVQHYILSLIQRIMEEGCYEFASRWIPDVLHQNNWTCPEAVELSTWKKFLPMSLPLNAITPITDRSLENALIDAVRIRNAAVHRHLCDNVEIRRMASQAYDLMSMFSDVTRQSKLKHLDIGLQKWDTEDQDDQVAKRNKLQAVLQEVSEWPLDDMDWTPNALSLQEIEPDNEEYPENKDYSIDEMDLD